MTKSFSVFGILLCFLFVLTFPCHCLYAQNYYHHNKYHFSFEVPPGWKKVPSDTVEKSVDEIRQFYKADTKRPRIEALFGPEESNYPFDLPYFVISVFTVEVNEQVIQELISSIQRVTSKSIKENWYGKYIDDYLISAPAYDKKRYFVTYTTDISSQVEKYSVSQKNINTLFLSKDGMVGIYFYCTQETINQYLPAIKNVIDTFKFDEGYEYRGASAKPTQNGIDRKSSESSTNTGINVTLVSISIIILIAIVGIVVARIMKAKQKSSPSVSPHQQEVSQRNYSLAGRLFKSWALGLLLTIPTTLLLIFFLAMMGSRLPDKIESGICVVWMIILFFTIFKPKATGPVGESPNSSNNIPETSNYCPSCQKAEAYYDVYGKLFCPYCKEYVARQ